ncbi:MAG: dioxygenase [Thalassolituus oleivorans]|uniref:DODA-type extradiol aromatic ring-opening family dioxygenase n=1 Tax=Thalassolituus oleivorans TaxID=187493 RepID=UPI001B466A94|nr:class III extradiol ring-cleavage dioxygenase [Thalassolituus oleivorans]MBQ0728258.1 dioxygenase [Thalassolituus oleivorans]MBQ0781953.1 dioxygenase [Thalassolituus oleivorans]
MPSSANILFISHGGGPMPLLGDAGHVEMVQCLQDFALQIRKPSAILVVSAHWEAKHATVTSATAPELIYDYSGFPPESYAIKYPAPGAPDLADDIVQALTAAGIEAAKDAQRGWDHGVFVPLKIMYPEADIPCVQLSLVKGLNADTHVALGKALQTLNHPGLLVIGSGFSFHNMRAFFAAETPEIRQANLAFQQWLDDTCLNRELNEGERTKRFREWALAPAARFCHPREEHLLPLHVCYGLAKRPADLGSTPRILGKASGMYLWRA